MRKRSKARFVNGVISALIVVFFAVHSLLGSLEGLLNLASPPELVMWLGISVVGAHVIASIVTSRQQLTDAEFPPSRRKKRHLALKWATGAALAIAVIAHIACVRMFGPDAARVNASATLVTLLLASALAVHIWVGAKSLITDLELNKGRIRQLRVAIVVFAIAIGCLIAVGIVWWR